MSWKTEECTKNPRIIKLVWIAFIFTLTFMAKANAQQLMHSFDVLRCKLP